MKLFLPLVLLACFACCQSGQGAILLFDDFDGLSTADLNGTSPDTRPGTEVWATPATTFKADGSMTAGGSAWLPYAFGSGIYEVKVDMSIIPSGSSGFTAISFVSGNQPFGILQFNSVAGTYSTYGLRANREVEFWAGVGNLGNVDGGTLGGTVVMTGSLRLILNTSGSNRTVDAFYKPSGSSELTIDLNGATAGTTFTYGTNPPAFTGVGFSSNLSTNSTIDSFTLSSIPEPAAGTLALGSLALLAMLRIKRVLL